MRAGEGLFSAMLETKHQTMTRKISTVTRKTTRAAFTASLFTALLPLAAGAQTPTQMPTETGPQITMPGPSNVPPTQMPGAPTTPGVQMPPAPASTPRQMPTMQTVPGIPVPGMTPAQTVASTPPRMTNAGTLETFAAIGGKTPIGIVLSQDGRVFMSFPRAMDPGAYSVAEIVNGHPVPYPNAAINRYGGGPQAGKLVSVQGITIDKAGRLWLLDSGVTGTKPTQYGGPKLVCVDVKTGKIVKNIVFDRAIAGPDAYLNDVRISMETGTAGTAFITDSSEKGPNGIVVVDLATGKAMRRLNAHPSTMAEPNFIGTAEGKAIVKRLPHKPAMKDKTGADGIALSGDGKSLYYCPNQGLHLYRVSVAALADPRQTDLQVANTVLDMGVKPGPSDGIECDSAGHVYVTDWEHNAVYQLTLAAFTLKNDNSLSVSDGPVPTRMGTYQTVAQSPDLVWPDSLAIGRDGYLYITATQLNRQAKYNNGVDVRHKPIRVYRVQVNAQPVLR